MVNNLKMVHRETSKYLPFEFYWILVLSPSVYTIHHSERPRDMWYLNGTYCTSPHLGSNRCNMQHSWINCSQIFMQKATFSTHSLFTDSIQKTICKNKVILTSDKLSLTLNYSVWQTLAASASYVLTSIFQTQIWRQAELVLPTRVPSYKSWKGCV